MKIELYAWDGETSVMLVSGFTMNNEAGKYALNLDRVSVMAGNYSLQYDLNYHKLKPFQTFDNFERPLCVQAYRGGWWYGDNECVKLFMNGNYINEDMVSNTSIMAGSFRPTRTLRRSRMMIYPNSWSSSSDANPCKHEGACEHLTDPLGHHCRCKSEWCGATCEVANSCKNGGTCESNEMTEGVTCKCAAVFTGQTCEDMIPEDTPSEDATSDDVTGEDTPSEDAISDDATSAHATGEDVSGEDATSGDATSEDATVEDVTRADTSTEEATGGDVTGEDVTSEDASVEDTTGEDATGEATTSEDKGPTETKAFGISSAAYDTTNCGIIVAVLILRRRLFDFFGF